jgi:hypothetical protein
MGIIKKHTTGSQPVNIWSLCLGVPTEATNPIIKIINGDKQNIGPALPHLLVGEQAGRQAYKSEDEKVTFNHPLFYEGILSGKQKVMLRKEEFLFFESQLFLRPTRL